MHSYLALQNRYGIYSPRSGCGIAPLLPNTVPTQRAHQEIALPLDKELKLDLTHAVQTASSVEINQAQPQRIGALMTQTRAGTGTR